MSWSVEYSAALDVRDEKEKSQFEVFDSYARLANKMGQTGIQEPEAANTTSEKTSVSPGSKTIEANTSTLSYREDFLQSQRMNARLQAELLQVNAEVQRFKRQSQIENKRLSDLTGQRNMLITKTKDRDEELRGKSKLVEEVQDELISLQLQLNVAEERSSKLQDENKELVDRWMARMGREADAMNKASKFH